MLILRTLTRVYVLLASMLTLASANTDVRRWTANGESFSAELVSYSSETGIAIFKDGNGKNRKILEENLSLTDQAWLREWNYIEERLQEKLERLGGKAEHYVTSGNYPTDLFIYHPPGIKNLTDRPMLLIFSPTGRAQRNLLHYAESAAELKVVLVACGQFRNSRDAEENREMDERFTEILPIIEKHVEHDPNQMMMGGSSGGAYRAFVYSVKLKRPWLGIFSNGGWLGPRNERLRAYPAMRVAVVNGNKDIAANSVVEAESKILNARGCEVAVFSFEGGHQTAPPEHTTDALKWILTGE